MSMKSATTLIVLLYILIHVRYRLWNTIFELKNITCHKYHEELFKKVSCNFMRRSSNNYSIGLQMMFSRELDRNFKAHVAIDVTPTNSTQIIHLIDLRFNCCMFLQQSLANQLVRPLMNEFKRVTNLPEKCPFKKETLYDVKNFSLTKKFMPTFLPSLDFNATLNLYDRNKLVASVQIIGNITQKEKTNKQ
ncbi:uncharacterized protein LOC105261607 [Musca domestica]|uniref:Uncharacterized protein LOC105261607 n=1 Tax=Musca domestica TaxID=7370 RepID=A0A1I8NIR9_MUSDO|nr:uncharacterized protein LOC105261607 [Musca domestica]